MYRETLFLADLRRREVWATECKIWEEVKLCVSGVELESRRVNTRSTISHIPANLSFPGYFVAIAAFNRS
jgi:hypothetical protein